MGRIDYSFNYLPKNFNYPFNYLSKKFNYPINSQEIDFQEDTLSFCFYGSPIL